MLPEQDRFIEQLYCEYFKKLSLYAASKIHSVEQIQDLIQETFMEAMLQIDRLMAHENCGGWLMETLKRKLQASERARQRNRLRFPSLETQGIGEIAIRSQELKDILLHESLKQTLNMEEHHLLKRVFLDGATHLELARELDITVSASQKRLERAKGKLRTGFHV